MHATPADQRNWNHRLLPDADGLLRVEVVDEDGETLPVARQVSEHQARVLLDRIQREASESRRPIKAVIRDPNFMAVTVITVKRLPREG